MQKYFLSEHQHQGVYKNIFLTKNIFNYLFIMYLFKNMYVKHLYSILLGPINFVKKLDFILFLTFFR